jgi:serine/threonine-protein kinase
VARLFSDTRALASIATAGIAHVFGAGMRGERAFVVRELLLGESLDRRLARVWLSPAQIASITQQLARALVAARDVGVMHHALKPSNVFLVPERDLPGYERVVVVDFGHGGFAARARERERGTAAYVAPEQWRGRGGGATDVYALGCIAFEMLCGRPPFVASTNAAMRHLHLDTPPPNVRALAPSVAEPVERIVMAMLAKDPAQRPELADVARQFGMSAEPEAALAATVRQRVH